jgi:hypothetical protein
MSPLLSAGTDEEVGGKPTASADANTVGRWGKEDGTSSHTLVGHCCIKLP